MKFKRLIFMFFVLISCANCTTYLDLYTDSNGCVVYDNTRNMKRAGDLELKYLLEYPSVYWDLIYTIKGSLFTDKVTKMDSILEINILDSNKLILKEYSNKKTYYDTIPVFLEFKNKNTIEDNLLHYKSFNVKHLNKTEEFRILYLKTPILVVEKVGTKEYFVFKRKFEQ